MFAKSVEDEKALRAANKTIMIPLLNIKHATSCEKKSHLRKAPPAARRKDLLLKSGVSSGWQRRAARWGFASCLTFASKKRQLRAQLAARPLKARRAALPTGRIAQQGEG